jgi:hypothetical protein
MQLKLYKQPYFDQTKPHEYRLLFEAIMDNGTHREDNDFYLYVWISDTFSVTAFQAVLDNELVLEYRSPQPLSFSRISASPINRSVVMLQTRQEQKRMREVMNELKSDFYGSFIAQIGAFIQGKAKQPPTLTEQEKQDFSSLIKTIKP